MHSKAHRAALALLCVQHPQLSWVLDWPALELLLLPSVLLCVLQLQLPWVLDWHALELLLLPSVLLCVPQQQLPWVLDWLALELLPQLLVRGLERVSGTKVGPGRNGSTSGR